MYYVVQFLHKDVQHTYLVVISSICSSDTMADIGVVLRQQQSKLSDQLAKKTHFNASEVEVFIQ